MAGVKTLANGRIKLAILTSEPANPATPTAVELTAGIDAGQLVAKNGTRVSATGSDTVNDPPLASATNAPVFDASNYEGSIAPYWLLDEDGAYAAADNDVFEAVKAKGSRVWLYFRDGLAETVAWSTDDFVDGFEVITDNPQRPSESGGYVKRQIPLGVQNAWLHVAVVAAPTGG